MHVGPAVRRFVKTQLRQLQRVAIGIAINGIKPVEGDARQIFRRWHAVENDRLVIGQGVQESHNRGIAGIGEKSVVPFIDKVRLGQCLDLREIHHHAVGGIARFVDDLAGQGDFDDVAVTVQMAALTFMVGDAVTGIELEAARDQHGNSGTLAGRRLYNAPMLSTDNHRRDSAGLRYVYPVISRRAGGVSVGINLNPNNACNWACLYCQVDNLTRGGPPPLDLPLLREELDTFLDAALHGDFMTRAVPESARRLVDVAFSGNGEPTSAPEFAAAVDAVIEILERHKLRGRVLLRLITNGSLLHRPAVQQGIARLGAWGGEVWFKLDRGEAAAIELVNGSELQPARVAGQLARCAELAPTWVQTCWFALDGQAPDIAAEDAYCHLLQPLAGRLAGVHLYGLARPSRQAAAPRLSALPAEDLQRLAAKIEKETGLGVVVSP